MDDRPQHFYLGISGTVCTVEYCTVDYIANAKVSHLVRPVSAFRRDPGTTEGVPRGFAVRHTLLRIIPARIFNLASSMIVM